MRTPTRFDTGKGHTDGLLRPLLMGKAFGWSGATGGSGDWRNRLLPAGMILLCLIFASELISHVRPAADGADPRAPSNGGLAATSNNLEAIDGPPPAS